MNFFKLKEALKLVNTGLKLKSVFGLDLLPNGIQFLEGNTCIYLAGSNFILLDLDNFQKTTISLKCRGTIERFHVAPNKKFVVCVEVFNKINSLITVDLQSNEKLTKNILSKIVNISISNDCEYIACQTGQPLWNLMLFSSNGLTFIAQSSIVNTEYRNDQTVTEISFFHNESKRILIIGNKLLKIYTLAKQALRMIHYIPCEIDLYSHSWYNKYEIILISSLGSVYSIELKQYKFRRLILRNQESIIPENSSEINRHNSKNNVNLLNNNSWFPISYEHQSDNYLNNSIRSKTITNPISSTLVCYNNGFFMCFNDNKIYYYERNEDSISYHLTFTFVISKNKNIIDQNYYQMILGFNINSKKVTLVAYTNNKVIYYYNLSQLITKKNSDELNLAEECLHSTYITGMDTCLKKPLIVTCGSDRWINVWNYETYTTEIRKNFDEDLLTVRFHPSGLFILLSTINSLQLMSNQLNNLSLICQFKVRSCNECRFSNGGHLFACVHGTVIQLFSTINYTEVGTIKAQNIGKVKTMQFTKHDRYLICCSMSGSIYIWDTKTFLLKFEITNRGLSFLTFCLHPNQEWIFGASIDKSIKQYKLTYINEQKTVLKYTSQIKMQSELSFKADDTITSMTCSYSGNIIVIGTNMGYLKIAFVPSFAVKEFRAHPTGITSLCVTPNDEFIITGTNDGLIVIWQISSIHQIPIIGNYDDAVLIDKTEYLNKLNLIDFTEQQLKDRRTDANLELRLKDLKFSTKLRDITNRFNAEMVSLREQIDKLTYDETNKISEFENKMRELIKFFMQHIHNEERFELMRYKFEVHKLDEVKTKLDDLKEEKLKEEEMIKVEKEQQLKAYAENMESKIKKMIEQHESKVQELKEKIEKTKDYRKNYQEEVDIELHELRVAYEKKLCGLKKQNISLKIEADLLRKKMKIQQDNIYNYTNYSNNHEKEMQDLIKQTTDKEKMEEQIKQEIIRSDNLAALSDSKISELRLICQELEKFNFVHKFTIDELTKQTKPIQKENSQYSAIIGDIKKEYNNKEIAALKIKNEISTIKLKLQAFNNEITKNQQFVDSETYRNGQTISEIHKLADYIVEDKTLKPCTVNDLIKKMCLNHLEKACGSNDEIEDEGKSLIKYVNRQRAILENTIKKQRTNLNRNKRTLKRRLSHIITENTNENLLLQDQYSEIQDLISTINTYKKVTEYMKVKNFKTINELISNFLLLIDNDEENSQKNEDLLTADKNDNLIKLNHKNIKELKVDLKEMKETYKTLKTNN